MKKKRIGAPVPIRALSKLWKIMRLSVFFLLLFVAQTFATVTYSQQTKLTLKMQSAKVIDVLSKIEDESEFFFLFNQKLVDVERQVNVDVKNESVDKILSRLFEKTNVSYVVKDRQIILTTANNESGALQQKSVSGKVNDSSGSPLPGVSVVIKGTTTGTITDANGNYSLSNVPGNATLQFSFVGMKGQEVPVTGKTTVNVEMEEETVGVDEVVVVGYGVQKKTHLTGAITQINAEVLQNRPVKTVSEGLQGFVAGFNVDDVSGAPESSPSLNIRGFTGFNSQGSPLVLVDGVERSISDVNPNDVESVTVLKDAAASAIYGSRAPYGVLLITTKIGKKGEKIRVNYSGSYQVGTPVGMPHWANSWEFAEKINEKYRNNMQPILFKEETIQKMKDFAAGKLDVWNDPLPNGQWGAHYDSYANNDWFSTMFKDRTPSQQHNVNFSGGSDNTTYYMGIGYNDASGLIVGSDDKRERYTTLLKVKTDVTDWLSLNFNMNYVKTDDVGVNFRGRGRDYVDIMNNAAASFPNWSDLSPNGSPHWLSSGPSMRGEGGNVISDQNEISASGGFDFKPVKGLSIKGNYSWKNAGTHTANTSFPIISINADGTTRNSGRSVTQSEIRRLMLTSNLGGLYAYL